MNPVKTQKELRSFGFIMAAALAVVTLAPLAHGRPLRVWSLVLSLTFFVFSLVWPSALSRPHGLWLKFGDILGWVNTRIVLGIMFFLVLTPLSFLRKALRFDDGFRNKRISPGDESYAEKVVPRDRTHFENQF